MGFMDKAKELAAKAEQAVNSLDGPNPTKEAEQLFRDLGARVFEREQGRIDAQGEADVVRIVEQLRALEAQVGTRLATASASAAPPPPGFAASTVPPPPAGVPQSPAVQSPASPPPPASAPLPPPPPPPSPSAPLPPPPPPPSA